MPWLINASQVEKFRKLPKNVVIIDVSWHAQENRDFRREFNEAHIVGAKFLDLNQFHDEKSILPNMLSRNEDFIADRLGAYGITNEHKIIFYDNSDLHTSCRAVWMMQVFGHSPNLLYVLDGGFAAWRRYGGKIESGERTSTPRKYEVNYKANLVRTLVQIKTNLHHPSEQVIDMRHPIRYAGGPEIRQNLRSGHIPNSYSFPYFTMFESDGRFKPTDKIQKQLHGIGVDLESPIVTYCGSGITAAILNFQLDLMNHPSHSLYDGSWSEWGADTLFAGEEVITERPVERSIDT